MTEWHRHHVKQRDEASRIRSSHAWRVLAIEFKGKCQRHRNDDGTLGKPCHICHQRIDYEAPRNSPNAFEADHYQPVTSHPHLAYMLSNLRPSHSRCNRARGAKAAPTQGQWKPGVW